MLVINYNGNKPTADYFKYSVQGNNKADAIRFLVSLNQGGLVFNENYHYYAKIQSEIDDFYDKVELSEIEFDDSNNLLKAILHLESKHTSHEKIEVSLCCENINDEIVWQTQLVKIAIPNGVNADEEIENNYPSVLAQLQQQIDDLKQQGGGGGGKSITLEIMPCKVADQSIYLHLLRVRLNKFTTNDIGTNLFLLHYSCRQQKKRNNDGPDPRRARHFKHPANFDSELTNVEKLGFGTIAGKRPSANDQNTFCDVPNFMPHNGCVQTEYEITEQHILQGYMDIDIGNELLCLLRPYITRDNLEANKYSFIGETSIIPKKGHYLTYAQYKNGVLECLPTNKLFICLANPVNTFINELVFFDEETNKYHLLPAPLITHLMCI